MNYFPNKLPIQVTTLLTIPISLNFSIFKIDMFDRSSSCL